MQVFKDSLMAFVTCPFLLPSSVRTHLSFPRSRRRRPCAPGLMCGRQGRATPHPSAFFFSAGHCLCLRFFLSHPAPSHSLLPCLSLRLSRGLLEFTPLLPFPSLRFFQEPSSSHPQVWRNETLKDLLRPSSSPGHCSLIPTVAWTTNHDSKHADSSDITPGLLLALTLSFCKNSYSVVGSGKSSYP